MTAKPSALLGFGRQVRFTARLRVGSPLHVGTGVNVVDDRISPDPEASTEERKPGSARIAKDGADRPYIPGASLKGALRAMLEEALVALGRKSAEANGLFGAAHGEDADAAEDGGGAMGALIVYGARFHSAPPRSDRPSYDPATGVALSARTAITAGRGVVDRHKLFHAEEVAPGVAFDFAMTFLPSADAARETKARELLALLTHEMMIRGLRLGRSTTDAGGRLTVDDARVVGLDVDEETGERRATPEPSGWQCWTPTETDKRSLAGRAGSSCVELLLTASGPFFVNDWDWAAKARDRKKAVKDKNPKAHVDQAQLRGLREKAGAPILPGASLMGALRSRASWLAALEEKRGSKNFNAAAVDNLFGTTKRKARLRLRSLTLAAPQPVRDMRAASVRLDRFAHGPMDSALFEVESSIGAMFRAGLEDGGMNAPGKALFDALLEDLARNGLTLGHAGNRGFGWFEVRRSTSP